MPESYTGDEGLDAAAAGYDILDGTEDRRQGWLAINKTRDYVAALKAFVTDAIAGISLTWEAISGKPSTFPPSAHTHERVDNGGNWFGWLGSSTWGTGDSVSVGNDLGVDGTTYGANTRLTGHLYVPASSAATAGWTVAYINTDGRLSRGSSSERYKTDITDAGDLGDLFAAPLREYRMRQDGTEPPTHEVDAHPCIGYIAEELIGTDLERFVVYLNGQVESIDFIAMLMAQNVELARRITALEAPDASN